MLVLSRKVEQEITVNGPATIKILRIKGNVVRIGVDADNSVKIMRKEVEERDARSARPEAAEASA